MIDLGQKKALKIKKSSLGLLLSLFVAGFFLPSPAHAAQSAPANPDTPFILYTYTPDVSGHDQISFQECSPPSTGMYDTCTKSVTVGTYGHVCARMQNGGYLYVLDSDADGKVALDIYDEQELATSKTNGLVKQLVMPIVAGNLKSTCAMAATENYIYLGTNYNDTAPPGATNYNMTFAINRQNLDITPIAGPIISIAANSSFAAITYANSTPNSDIFAVYDNANRIVLSTLITPEAGVERFVTGSLPGQ